MIGIGKRTLVLALVGVACVAIASPGFAQKNKISKNPPAPPVTPAVATGTAIRDDFSDSQWGTVTDADKAIQYEDGALRINVITKNYFVWSTPDTETYRDVHMEMTVRTNGSDSTTAYGFLCDQEGTTGNFYYLAVTPAGEYAIALAREGQNDLFLTNDDKWATADVVVKNEKFYRLGADCGNGRLALYVDGHQIASAEDASYVSGGVGVMVWSGENATNTNIHFDDFVLTPLD